MYCKKVKEFTQACNDSLPNRPQQLDKNAVKFITQMVKDELKELEEASNIIDQADAFVDMMYYICDAAVRNGINLDPIFEIVHHSNMNKVINGKVKRREDGKIMKPNNWIPPEPLIQKNLEKQKEIGSFI